MPLPGSNRGGSASSALSAGLENLLTQCGCKKIQVSSVNAMAEDHFFVSEFGVNISVHLIKTLDLNVGTTYRLVSGANGFVKDNDFFNYSIHAGLRFRLAGRK